MKTINSLRVLIVLIGILLSACAPAVSTSVPANVGSGKPLTDVIFTGVIESMNGDQWTIAGQMVKVDSSILKDGPYQVGDSVKVEASVAADGSVVAQRVESPSAADLAQLATSTPDAQSGSQGLVFDNSGAEAVGTVDALTETSITVGGQSFTLLPGVEIKGEVVPGAVVKLHFAVNADGFLSVTEIELADPTQLGDDNSNDDNSNATNVNDDNSNDDNGNDDASNSNDDHGNDDNSNDDHGNDDDSNDDHGGNDDNSNDSNNNG